MPLCRASTDDMNQQLIELIQQSNTTYQQLKQLIQQTGQSNTKVLQQQMTLKQLEQQLSLLRQIKNIRCCSIEKQCIQLHRILFQPSKDGSKCQFEDISGKLKEDRQVSTNPLQPSDSSVRKQIKPSHVLFLLQKEALLIQRTQTYSQISISMNKSFPHTILATTQQLLRCKQQLQIYKSQTDRTKMISERISQLKIENAALREQVSAYDEFVQGEESALLMKIEALGRQRETANEAVHEAEKVAMTALSLARQTGVSDQDLENMAGMQGSTLSTALARSSVLPADNMAAFQQITASQGSGSTFTPNRDNLHLHHTSLLQQQVDFCLSQIDAQESAESLLADYTLRGEKINQLTGTLNHCQADLADMRQNSVSKAEYERIKSEMQARLDEVQSVTESAGKMDQNELYREYLALLRRFNSTKSVVE